jgi:2-polyprenyl-3-methyl-5-hydroxy-6-metoxy-1,4-benzoquinol methylase
MLNILEETVVTQENCMQRTTCRHCGGAVFEKSLLDYYNMPSAAQNLPTKEELADDVSSNLQVCQCSECGLVQLGNEPVPYYKDVIRASAFSEDMKAFRIKQFSSWAQTYQLVGSNILEVGCGRGEYLSLMNMVGMHAYGLENSKKSVQDCIDQGLQVFQGYFDHDFIKINASPFDGFMCLNFMEHWPNPKATLRGIRENLAIGAVGFVEVPNFDMIIEKGLYSEFISDHLLYFTQDTLISTLQTNGFEVLECKPVWQDYILSATVRKRSRTNLDFLNNIRLDISAQLNQYINKFPSGNVAVWGAGHQALAVLALADLGNKIAYVVDSAPFKQGRYTPATHIPIVSPEQLVENPIGAIIIMAASYSDEVARLIRKRHGNSIRVAVLRDYGLEEI